MSLLACEKFVPHPLIPGGHLQTYVGHLWGEPPQPEDYDVVPVGLADGDELLVHVDRPLPDDEDAPLVLLMHGLSGCSESKYILRISDKLRRAGIAVARFNHRGCGRGASARARGIYHAGRTEDLDAALAELHRRWPRRPLRVAGFSLSANIVLKYLATEPATSAHRRALEAALAVCPPIDLAVCANELQRPHNLVLDRYYTRRLVRTAAERARLFPDMGAPAFPRRLNLSIFDEIYTAPLGGFRHREDYYEQASSKKDLHLIETPTAILAVEDDPVVPASMFSNVNLSSAVELRIERHGGHMGFLAAEKTSFGDHRWLDAAVCRWVIGT